LELALDTDRPFVAHALSGQKMAVAILGDSWIMKPRFGLPAVVVAVGHLVDGAAKTLVGAHGAVVVVDPNGSPHVSAQFRAWEAVRSTYML
jgi:hypothetical protein